MPKPNQTMLDQIAASFKSMGKPSPFREMKLRGEFTDPMIKARANQQLAGNKLIKVDPSWSTPERVKYQRGLEEVARRKRYPVESQLQDFRDDMSSLEDAWNNAIEEAKYDMVEGFRSGLSYQPFEDIGPDYLEAEEPVTDLRAFWNDADYPTPEEFGERYDRLSNDIDEYESRLDYMNSPEYRMELQRQSPRYRNYQRAMQQRQENAQMGRLNAAIMNLYRQGYSMPEIREILRNREVR
jgi:hypothetical protein